MDFRWRTLAALLFLLLLTAGFYWQLTLSSRYTWLENPDQALQVRPWLDYESRELHAGRVPLWAPYEWGGQSLIGQVQPGLANPLNWPLFAMPLVDGHIPVQTLHWYWVLIHWLAAVFTYWLCRDLGCGRMASILGGAVYALAGFIGHSDTPQFLMGAVWIPVILLFLARVGCGRRVLASAAWCGAALGAAFLGGHHNIPTYTAVVAGCIWLVLLWTHRRERRMWLAAALFGATMLLVAAVQILPAIEYGRQSLRWVGAPDALRWNDRIPYSIHAEYSLGLHALPGLVLPGLAHHAEPFVGMVAVMLALIVLRLCWRRWEVRMLGAVALGGLLLALGSATPVEHLAYLLIPMEEKARYPAMAIVICQCAVAALAALGIECYLADRSLTVAAPIRAATLREKLSRIRAAAVREKLSSIRAATVREWLSSIGAATVRERSSPIRAATVREQLSRIRAAVREQLSRIRAAVREKLSRIRAATVREQLSRIRAAVREQLSRIRAAAREQLSRIRAAVREQSSPIRAATVREQLSRIRAATEREQLSPIRAATVREQSSPIRAATVREQSSPIRAATVRERLSLAWWPAGFAAAVCAYYGLCRLLGRPTYSEPLWPAVAASLGLAVLLVLRWKRGAPAVALALFLIEVLALPAPVQPRNGPTSYARMMESQSDIADFLRRQPGWFRVDVDEDVVPYNFGDWYGIEQFGGYTASMTAAVHFVVGHRETPRLFGVAYRVALKPSNPYQFEVFQSRSGLKVYRDPHIGPPLWIEHRAEDTPCAGDQFQLILRTPQFMSIEAAAGCPGLLVVGDPWFTGWRAWVDGRRVRIQQYQGVIRAVPLAAGAHRVEFRYQPGSVWWGAALSLLGLALALFVHRTAQ